MPAFLPPSQRQPDFNNLLAVLRRQEPDRPTLFEFFLNDRLYRALADDEYRRRTDPLGILLRNLTAYRNAGYDYTTILLPNFSFQRPEHARLKSISQNDGGVIMDRASFQAYEFPDPDGVDFTLLDQVASHLPPGMKIIVWGPNGVLENAIELVGFDRLCTMIYDDEPLVRDLFAAIGSRLERYYELAMRHPAVGAGISNDDWGFKTQTMFHPRHMRQFVFPWHKRIVARMHAAGKPAILHSCGYFEKVIEDVIEDMQFDGRHSYEDNILPVEEAYERYHTRIAILGGIDLDYICRSTPQQVFDRSHAMLERVKGRGGYALGTGNSVPDYVPDENYYAMISAAFAA